MYRVVDELVKYLTIFPNFRVNLIRDLSVVVMISGKIFCRIGTLEIVVVVTIVFLHVDSP